MIAVLIFAGKSKRFWPLTEKSFFPIAGTNLLETQVKRLQAAGIRSILLVAGAHNATDARNLFPKLPVILQEDLALGMRGALLSALPQCGKESVLIVSANDVVEVEAYKNLLQRSKKLQSGGLILARRVKHYFPGGYLSLSRDRITAIVEKPDPGTEPSDLVNIVAHVHANVSTLLQALQSVSTKKDDGYEVALDTLIKKERYEAIEYVGAWNAVKYPWHLLDLLSVLLPTSKKPSIHRTAEVHRTAVIEGAVIIEKNVRILAHASVIGPCYIGEGAIIANNALVRGSSIGPRSVIGYGSEIARSIVSTDVWTHMTYLGDSIIGARTSFGGGTIAGNVRLDEEEISSRVASQPIGTHRRKLGVIMGEDVKTGIHTSLAPGVKIGARSYINSATLVVSDVPEDSFVKMGKQGLVEIRENRMKREVSDRNALRSKI